MRLLVDFNPLNYLLSLYQGESHHLLQERIFFLLLSLFSIHLLNSCKCCSLSESFVKTSPSVLECSFELSEAPAWPVGYACNPVSFTGFCPVRLYAKLRILAHSTQQAAYPHWQSHIKTHTTGLIQQEIIVMTQATLWKSSVP